LSHKEAYSYTNEMEATCDQTWDMLFQVLGFCSVFGQKCEERKFQAGGETYFDLLSVVSFKEQWWKKLGDLCSSGCD